VRLLDASGDTIGAAPVDEDVAIGVRLKVRRPGSAVRCAIDVHTKGVLVFRATQPDELAADARGVYDLFVTIPARLLSETTYAVSVMVTSRRGKELEVSLPNALTFMVYGSGDEAAYKKGVVSPQLEWHVESHADDKHEQPVA
jgi:hypothetical protein